MPKSIFEYRDDAFSFAKMKVKTFIEEQGRTDFKTEGQLIGEAPTLKVVFPELTFNISIEPDHCKFCGIVTQYLVFHEEVKK